MFLLQNFCKVGLLEKQPRFKISSIGPPLKYALEVDADLVECALKVSMSIPAFLGHFFNRPEIAVDTTGLCGLT